MVGAKKMSEVKKRLMKRVTIEYYEDWSEVEIEYSPRSERVIKKTTKKETWCGSSKGDPIVSYTSEVY